MKDNTIENFNLISLTSSCKASCDWLIIQLLSMTSAYVHTNKICILTCVTCLYIRTNEFLQGNRIFLAITNIYT